MPIRNIWISAVAAVIIVFVAWFFLDHKYVQVLPSDLPPQAKNFMHTITIKTNMGDIVFETYDADAPKAVENFISLADKHFYDGTLFHRVIEGFMIQGGDPLTKNPGMKARWGTGGPGYEFADELDPGTPSYRAGYVRGTVAMANSGPNTNGSQFFIMQRDTALPHNYTIFGKVISGMDTVDKIAAVPVDANDDPLSPVVVQSVTERAGAAAGQ